MERASLVILPSGFLGGKQAQLYVPAHTKEGHTLVALQFGPATDTDTDMAHGVLGYHRKAFPGCNCCADLEARYLTPEVG